MRSLRKLFFDRCLFELTLNISAFRTFLFTPFGYYRLGMDAAIPRKEVWRVKSADFGFY